MAVDAGDLGDMAGGQVPDVEVAAARGEEDAAAEWGEGGSGEWCVRDMQCV